MAIKRHEATEKRRSIHLARTNIDYQIKYPNEVRNNPEKKILLQCHPEAASRIHHECEVYQSKNMQPKPKFVQERFNRRG